MLRNEATLGVPLRLPQGFWPEMPPCGRNGFTPLRSIMNYQYVQYAFGSRLMQTKAVIPFIPTHDPQLGRPVYEMVFGHLVMKDKSVGQTNMSRLTA